jgi:hypothetical protein
VITAACGPEHHVSPWGQDGRLSVDAYVRKPDLGAELAEIDRETRAHGLDRTIEIDGTLGKKGGEAFKIRGYAGKDSIGRPIHAVRVATARGVVLAVGPVDIRDVDRSRATELVPALYPGPDPKHPLEGAAFASGTDLTGDGSPDLVLTSDRGALEVWHIEPLGAAAYEIVMATTPTSAADVDRDGKVDLVGRIEGEPDDQLKPELDDVATFERGRFTNTSAAARAYQAARLIRVEAAIAKAEKPSDEERLTHAIERAWHAVLAGQNASTTLATFDKEKTPRKLSIEVERWRKAIAKAARGG